MSLNFTVNVKISDIDTGYGLCYGEFTALSRYKKQKGLSAIERPFQKT